MGRFNIICYFDEIIEEVPPRSKSQFVVFSISLVQEAAA